MRVIARSTLIAFWTEHPDAMTALQEWFAKVRRADWSCFADVRRTFGSADSVGGQHYVFNIRGNAYRLVAVVKFSIRTVYIRFVGTHSEYDRIDATKI